MFPYKKPGGIRFSFSSPLKASKLLSWSFCEPALAQGALNVIVMPPITEEIVDDERAVRDGCATGGYLEPTTSNAIRIERRCREILRKHIAAQLVADLMIAFAIQNKGELIRQWANPETQIVEVDLIDFQPSPATDL